MIITTKTEIRIGNGKQNKPKMTTGAYVQSMTNTGYTNMPRAKTTTETDTR